VGFAIRLFRAGAQTEKERDLARFLIRFSINSLNHVNRNRPKPLVDKRRRQ
jgi:hypothetical protein